MAKAGILNSQTLIVPVGQEDWRPLASIVHGSDDNQDIESITTPATETPPPLAEGASDGIAPKPDVSKLSEKLFREARLLSKKELSKTAAFKWVFILALLSLCVVLCLEFWFFAVFFGVWIAAAYFGLRVKQSKVTSLGGGFVLACVAVALSTAVFKPATSSPGERPRTSSTQTRASSESKSAADASEKKRAFVVTAEEFRTAFNRQKPQLEIESFKDETIGGEPWVSCVFPDGSGLKINLESGTRRICTLMCAFTKNPSRKSSESYALANKAICVLSPDADSMGAWGLVNRLTNGVDGSDDVKGKGELFRNLSVSMISTGTSDSGLPLVMLVFTPRPAEADLPKPEATTRVSSPHKRFHQAKAGTPVFFFKPLYASKTRSAFEYERLPSGAVRFIDGYDHREYCMTQPFEMQERPFPKSAVDEGPVNDTSEKERAMNEKLKFYIITSHATLKGVRYSTFRYAIDRSGTLHFDQRGSKLAILPPYIIEENFVGEGNHPQIPDYPPSPDRG